MDKHGYSYDIFKKFLLHLGYTREDECCIANIEVWEKGIDTITFSTNTPDISVNLMPDLVADVGKEMRDFFAFVKISNGDK